MPGDQLHEEATGPETALPGARRERTGPRHAAPKKPFLTRLHVPAGKAVAMAAMPSAVLLSLGVTPQLAYAKPLPKNPFSEGPCVSQEDKAEEEAREEAAAEAERKAEEAAARERAKAEAEAAEKAQEAREAAEDAAEEAAEEATGDAQSVTGGSSGDDSSSGSGGTGGTGDSGATSGGSAEPAPEPSPSTEEGSSGGLLGGLLGGVSDALGGGGDDERTDAQAEPQTSQPSQTPEVSTEDSSDPVGDAVDEVEKGLDDTVGKVEDTVEGAEGALPVPETPAEEDAGDETAEQPSGAEETEPVTGEDGERAFPCVEEKQVAGTDEQTPATLPNQPWVLKASSLTIRGQDYEGVFNVRTADGDVKQVLKFTADSIDIGDLHQIVQGPNGTQFHVRAAPGSTSTIRDGQVTLYTERLEGKLFGLIPIVFDPEHPPPLNISDVYFTDVTVKQAGQFGGTLTVPGLTSTITAG